ncbi:DUF4292 domain-containing protein [Melioribacteraceae bacterium 4301-Me]|uniref:DUF4292 domain-containing protein n=1 Tax=Pyranulibacter aquaticus TaxID=3163344 RepID=UPI00359A43C0
MNKKNIYTIFPLLIIIVLQACVPSKPIKEELILSSDRLVKKLEANRRQIKTFRGTGVLSIETPLLNAKSNFEVLIKKPDSVKVSFFGPFGIDLAQSLITNNTFQFYDVINNRLFTGKLEEDVIKQILKVDISFDELIDALIGSVNLTDKLRREPDKYQAESSFYKLSYLDSLYNREYIYVVQSDNLSIRDYKIVNMPSDLVLEGVYSNFKDFDQVPLPYNILLNYKEKNQKLVIEYRNISVNQNVENLKIELPPDVKRIEW